MNQTERRELPLQYTLFAALLSIIIFIAAFFISYASSGSASGMFNDALRAFARSSFFWILVVMVFLLPGLTFAVSWRLFRQLNAVRESIEKEDRKIRRISAFTQDLIQGRFSAELEIEDDQDVLGRSLVKLRDTLRINQENEGRRREDEGQRNWLAEGQAHFGEVLRNHTGDLDNMSFLLIKDLTRYIGAIQGGFYMLDDTDPENRHFRLIAFFAYDRRKFADQQIKWGDGLIGTCALEKKPIHMKKVPDGYMRVTSGLGETTPGSILLQPLLYEEAVYGVLEIATMKAFEEHHLNLVEKVSGSIGSTLAAVKNNLRTAKLLEDSKAQALTLSSQEEEMRQNMEELKATQEEAARQTLHYESLEQGMDQVMMRAEFNMEGRLLNANRLFIDKFGIASLDELKGKDLRKMVATSEKETVDRILREISKEKRSFSNKIRFSGEKGRELWVNASFACMGGKQEEDERILMLSADISLEQQENKKLVNLQNNLDRIELMAEMDIHGAFLTANTNFMDFAGLNADHLNNITFFDLVAPLESESFMKRWDAIIKGIDFDGIVRISNKNEEDKWLKGSISGIRDLHQQMDRILFVGHDITGEKFLDMENRNLSEQLKDSERMLKDNEKLSNRKLRDARTELMTRYREIEERNTRNEALLEDAGDAIIITRSDNRIALFNKAAESLWGYDKTAVMDKHVGILFPDDLIEQSDFLLRYVGPGDMKITGQRRKERITDFNGNKKEVLFLVSKTKINNENAYIAFVQPEEG